MSCDICRDPIACIYSLTHPPINHIHTYFFISHSCKNSLTYILIYVLFLSSNFSLVHSYIILGLCFVLIDTYIYASTYTFAGFHCFFTRAFNCHLLSTSPCQTQLGLTLEGREGTTYSILKGSDSKYLYGLSKSLLNE